MKKNPVFSDRQPSELFLDLIVNGGTPVNDCEHCGRTHYDSSGEFMEDGELKELERKHKLNPGKYHPQNGTIRWGYLAGKQTVLGCPCNVITVYEDLFWSHRQMICEYVKNRAEQELKDVSRALGSAIKTLDTISA